MKLFFKRILFFLVLILLTLLVLEYIARKHFPVRTDLHVKFESLQTQKDAVEILVLGNSHLEKAVNPEFIQANTFNMAFSAQDLYYDYHVFEHFADQLHSLHSLIIGVDYFSFGYDESSNAMYYVRDYHRELGIRPRNGISYLYLLNHSVFWLNRPKFVRYLFSGFPEKQAEAFCDQLKLPEKSQHKQLLLASGFRATFSSLEQEELEQHAQQISKSARLNYDAAIEKENAGYLEQILKIAEHKKLRVLLVQAPVSSAYESRISVKQKERFSSILKQILDKYPGVDYLDATAWLQDEPACFYNSNHLNEKGAESFSLDLDQQFLNNQSSFPYNYGD
jgi:hypothetical protein